MSIIITTEGFKFIHWDYIKHNSDLTNADVGYKIFTAHKRNTKIKIGVRFRFTVRFYFHEEITFSCIGEETFLNENISSFDFIKCRSLIEQAVFNFTDAFHKKFKEQGLSHNVNHTVKDNEVNSLLNRLKS